MLAFLIPDFLYFLYILYRVWIKRFSSNLPFPNSMAFVYTYHVGTGYGKKQCCGAGSSWSDPATLLITSYAEPVLFDQLRVFSPAPTRLDKKF